MFLAKITTILLMVLLITGFLFLYQNEQVIVSNEKSYSIYKRALKYQKSKQVPQVGIQEQISRNNSRSIASINTQFEEQKLEEDELQLSEEEFNQYFNLPQSELAQKLDFLKNQQELLKDSYYNKNQEIPKVLLYDVEIRIALAVLLARESEILTANEIEQAGLDSSDWYFIKTFCASRDFQILLSQNALTYEMVNPQKLKELYGSSHHFSTKIIEE